MTADEAGGRQRRLLPGWRRRRAQNANPADLAQSATRQLDLVPVDALSMPLAGFGYVTAGDSVRLAAALKSAAAEIARPTVHFAGGATLEFEGDRQVWVRLAGDVEALTDAAREISRAVEPLGFYVDRRKFRPLLAIGTVNDFTTAPYLQGLLDALDAFSGLPWELDHVDLIRPSYATGPETEELDWLPLHP
ncbi:MAG: hypothetical protein M3Y71_08900 [Actinomycetota bacterium]|nr:hypothetical protein [Actinomycetota bacterium]